MNVVFDGICLADGPPTGVARAFLTGLEAYATLGAARCFVLVPSGSSVPPLPAAIEIVPAPRGAVRRQLQLPRLLRRLAADVLHSPVAAVPLSAPCATIATVHDLPWLHPELREPASARRRLATRLALRRATAVIAPSAFTAADLARMLPQRQTVRVVPHATEPGAAPDARAASARRGPLLVLGDDRPRKNRPNLVAAWRLAQATRPELPALQFVGPRDGFVDEPRKRQLLAQCRAVVHVSWFEGFGLPVLEGLAHGAPVLCSDLPPHHEIAAEHALYVPPGDPAAIAAGLLRIDGDEALRRSLALGGHQRAQRFRPTAVASAWRRLHEELAR